MSLSFHEENVHLPQKRLGGNKGVEVESDKGWGVCLLRHCSWSCLWSERL